MATQGYTVLVQVHETPFDTAIGQAVDGWRIIVRDDVTGTTVPVFVPDTSYPQDAQKMIEARLSEVRQVANLGKPGAPAPTPAE